jgi:hypothetical protein
VTIFFKLIAVMMLGFVLSCAHTKIDSKRDPRELLAEVCSVGASVKEASGTVWLKGKSPDLSGQAPAQVKVVSPETLDLEVTNLLGGAEARIQVRGDVYQVYSAARDKTVQRGQGSWGGIPLRWSTALFLGKVPCPVLASGNQVRFDPDQDELHVEASQEKYVYKLKNWEGRAWPTELAWERVASKATHVDFYFDSPEDSTRSPLKWEAVSSSGDRVTVRWKDRMTH